MIIFLTIGLEVLHAAGQRHALAAGDHEPAARDQEVGGTPSPGNNTTLMLFKLVPWRETIINFIISQHGRKIVYLWRLPNSKSLPLFFPGAVEDPGKEGNQRWS